MSDDRRRGGRRQRRRTPPRPLPQVDMSVVGAEDERAREDEIEAAQPATSALREPTGEGEAEQSEVESLRLSELLREDLVALSLSAAEHWGAVDELIDILVAAGELPDELTRAARRAIREREAIRPTGWKYGLAFPNGRVRGLRRIAAALGLSRSGIEFGCRDRMPARIVVLLLFPEARYARFAPGIAEIADTLEDPALRETILSARRASEVVEAIEEAEMCDFP